MRRRLAVAAVLLIGCCLGCCNGSPSTSTNESGYENAGSLVRDDRILLRKLQHGVAETLVRRHAGTTASNRDPHTGSQWVPWWILPTGRLSTRPPGLLREGGTPTTEDPSDVWAAGGETSATGLPRAVDDDVDNRDATNPNTWTEFGKKRSGAGRQAVRVRT
ncbi:uncharacterized protein LOC144910317 [Branchiostoma floridae x Branchiostoma belcheri]